MMATKTTTLLREVIKADPDFYRDKRKQPEYEFSKRIFYADPEKRGAYADEE